MLVVGQLSRYQRATMRLSARDLVIACVRQNASSSGISASGKWVAIVLACFAFATGEKVVRCAVLLRYALALLLDARAWLVAERLRGLRRSARI